MIGGQILHFVVSLALTLIGAGLIKPDKLGKWLPFWIVMMVGCLKEIFDVTVNPYNLSDFYLTIDTGLDILSNVSGSLFAMFILSFRRNNG